MLKKIITTLFLILFLTSCSTFDIDYVPSHNSSERIKFLVLHYTADDFHDSLQELVDAGHGVSAHYLIPESGDASYPDETLKIRQLVKENKRAWHAGRSFWQGRNNVNDQSIGIEIVNMPQCKKPQLSNVKLAIGQDKSEDQFCFYPDYDPKQIELLIELAKNILKRHADISPTHVIGHSDIAPNRKNDPGPRFPWYQLYKQGIGAWYDKKSVLKYWNMFLNQQPPKIGLIQKALRSYGYGIVETGELDQATVNTLSAFQMHFLPWRVTGQPDIKTEAILFALLDKYFPEKLQQIMLRYHNEISVKNITTKLISKGQIDTIFPEINRSTRELVNDRTVFKSYRKRGQIIINDDNATSADIYVNGKKLNIAKPLQPHHSYHYSLKKRTKSGDNTLHVENVMPEGSHINVVIPYPKLVDKSQLRVYKHRFIKVDQLISNDVKNGFPGAVLVVIKDGAIIKNTAYGYARKYADGGTLLKYPEKMTTKTLFDLASNTKMFATNFALMKLVSEGKLDVDKPIVHYLPLYRGAARETRLVKDLLTHNAGYAPEIKFFTHKNKLGEAFFSQNKQQTKQLILTKVPFKVGRHTKRMYSDTDYILLGMLIERITGMALDTYVENEIYHPLHLDNTVFNPLQKGFSKNQIAATEIQGNTRGGRINFANIRHYVLQGEVHDEKAFYSLGGVAGHAGLFSTAKEIGILAQTLLNRGGYGKVQLFKAKVIDQFIKPDDGNGSYGLGWRRADNGVRKWQFGPYASPLAYGHTGWTGTVTVIDPEYDLAIVLLTNARHSKVVGNDKDFHFKGKQFETGKYGSVVSLIYEAILNTP